MDNKPVLPAAESKDAPKGKDTELCDSLWGHLLKTFSTIAVPTVEHVAGMCLKGYSFFYKAS